MGALTTDGGLLTTNGTQSILDGGQPLSAEDRVLVETPRASATSAWV